MSEWPIVYAQGEPHERGLAYGRQSADRIHRSIEIYRDVFRYYADMSWDDVCRQARTFEEPIAAYDADILPEIEGIAEGAGVARDDVLAINVRTEVKYGLRRRECTSIAALPEATADGHPLLAQNWDWHTGTAETCVLLVMAPLGRPAFACLVEAGLLAKMGMNEAGIGLVCNALVCDRDRGMPGVPFHVILRRILTSASIDEAATAVLAASRASSANYVIGSPEGDAADIESAPGGLADVFPLLPDGGVLAHTNHFVSPRFTHVDTWFERDGADSLFRLDRARRFLDRVRGRIDRDTVGALLRDHVGGPPSICCHPDPAADPEAQDTSVTSVILDLTERTMSVTAGPPCRNEYVTYRSEELFEAARSLSVGAAG